MQQVARPDEALAQWFAAAIDVAKLWAEARAALSELPSKLPPPPLATPPMDLTMLAVLVCSRTGVAGADQVHGHITKALPHSPLLAAEAAGAEPCTPRTYSS